MAEEEGGIEKKIREAGDFIEKALEHAEDLHIRINIPYYQWLVNNKLWNAPGGKYIAANDKQIEELADSIVNGLKDHLKEIGIGLEKAEAGKEKFMEDAYEGLLAQYFGINRQALIETFKKTRRITKELIVEIISKAEDALVNRLHSSAVANMGHEYVSVGKEYIGKMADKYKINLRDIGVSLKDINESEPLKNAIVNLHRHVRKRKVQQAIEEYQSPQQQYKKAA